MSRIAMRGLGAAMILAVVLGPTTSARADERVNDGAPISPAFAQALFSRMAQLREPDGCGLVRFDTSRYRIAIGVRAASGAEHTFEFATVPGLIAVQRSIGDWVVSASPDLARDCPTTTVALEQVLASTSAPNGGWHVGTTSVGAPSPYVLLATAFVLLLLGTIHVLCREMALHRPPWATVVALVVIWAIALGLRLWISPRTFLHEYYHIAETVPAYLSGEVTPGYGKTGPMLFRLVARVLGLSNDLRVIFVTNAVVSSLAVPAAAMLVLAVVGSWPQALCAAVLLAVLPQHLRFSAAEDLIVQAVTFGLWALALLSLYARTRRLEDALLAALALGLATQTRPEMIFFPAFAAALLVCTQPGAWRLFLSWRTLVALGVLVVLLVPHLFDVRQSLNAGNPPTPVLPPLDRYVRALVLFKPEITPWIYRAALLIGVAWSALHRPGWLAWVIAIYVFYSMFHLSIGDNLPYHLRSQIFPMSMAVLIAAGAASVWTYLWRARPRAGIAVGAALLAGVAIAVVADWRGFVGELKDQQLEWSFLEHSTSRLPDQGTLLTAVETGGRNLDAFPEFLLARAGKRYAMVDVRRAARGEVAWPAPDGEAELIFYQGMFCYFAFDTSEPKPDPITAACRAVAEHYELEPIMFEDLDTTGYSAVVYAPGPYRIGFYRLKPRAG